MGANVPVLAPPISHPAGSDLSASIYRAVVISSGKLALPTAGGRILGILLNKPEAADEAGLVGVLGTQPAVAGGVLSAGDIVKVDSAGKFVLASASDIAAGSGVGVAVTAAAADGDMFCLLLLANAAGTVAVTGFDSVTAPGALSVTTEITELSVDGTDAFTLADGKYVGQTKRIRCIAAVNTPVGTVTPATVFAGAPATYVFTAPGQEVLLMWTATGWKCIGGKTAGTDAPAAASTLRPLVEVHVVAISGTNDWVLGDGIFIGQRKQIAVASAAATPVGTISGIFYDEDGSGDGTDINLNAAADQAFIEWDGNRWVALTLVSATIS